MPCGYHVPFAVDGPVFFMPFLLYSDPLSPGGVKLVEAQEKWPHLLAERGQDSLEKHDLVVEKGREEKKREEREREEREREEREREKKKEEKKEEREREEREREEREKEREKEREEKEREERERRTVINMTYLLHLHTLANTLHT